MDFEEEAGRPLHGGRGLKLVLADQVEGVVGTPPSRGARIETPHGVSGIAAPATPPSRGARIETSAKPQHRRGSQTPPSRGARIETGTTGGR